MSDQPKKAVNVSAKIKEEDHVFLKELAVKDERTVSYFVSKAVEEYVKRLKAEKAKG